MGGLAELTTRSVALATPRGDRTAVAHRIPRSVTRQPGRLRHTGLAQRRGTCGHERRRDGHDADRRAVLIRSGHAWLGEQGRAIDAALDATNAADRATNLEHAQDTAGDSALAGAYTFLQRLIGGIAVTLPFVVSIGAYTLDGGETESSIHTYTCTGVGNVFVGTLSALGVFFLSYQHKPLPGYTWDNYLAYGAQSAAAIGVALFPTADAGSLSPGPAGGWCRRRIFLSARALFLLLAFFSLRAAHQDRARQRDV